MKPVLIAKGSFFRGNFVFISSFALLKILCIKLPSEAPEEQHIKIKSKTIVNILIKVQLLQMRLHIKNVNTVMQNYLHL